MKDKDGVTGGKPTHTEIRDGYLMRNTTTASLLSLTSADDDESRAGHIDYGDEKAYHDIESVFKHRLLAETFEDTNSDFEDVLHYVPSGIVEDTSC